MKSNINNSNIKLRSSQLCPQLSSWFGRVPRALPVVLAHVPKAHPGGRTSRQYSPRTQRATQHAQCNMADYFVSLKRLSLLAATANTTLPSATAAPPFGMAQLKALPCCS